MSRISTRNITLAVSALAIVAVTLLTFNPFTSQYEVRDTAPSAKASDAMSFLHSLRANGVTGEIDPQDVINARLQADAVKTKTTSLTWESRGPDNYGGRTRAILVDRNNSNIVYAGSVSGGLYRSTNGGSTWNPVSPADGNLSVVSLCQAANGDIYYGTGEVFQGYNGSGANTTPNMMGGGIYKSTDGGLTFSHLSATTPTGSSGSASWASVAVMEAHPTNANTIYAGTNSGLMRTTDGGTTWTSIHAGNIRDMDMAPTGKLIINAYGQTKVTTDDGNTFTELSKPVPGATDLPRKSGGRIRYAISPQDENYIYVIQTAGNQLSGVYRSTDNGSTWSKIGQRGNNFDPLCNGSGSSQYCQGVWDLLFQVSAGNKDQIFLGGITVWKWSLSGGWAQLSTNNSFGTGNPYYLHSDSHDLIFDPNNSNIAWTVNDGGVFKSNDGGATWAERNLGYNTFQFYRMSLGRSRQMMGGTQDNGTVLVTGKGFNPNNGEKLIGGDGGFTEQSWLVPSVMFSQTLAEKALYRSDDYGDQWSGYTSGTDVNLPNLLGLPFANWTIPTELYETTSDAGSHDTIHYTLPAAMRSMGYGDGIKKNFAAKLRHAQNDVVYVTDSFRIVAGQYVLTADAQGNLSGDGTGVFHADSGYFEVTFNTAPLAEVIASCDVYLAPGTEVELPSLIGGHPVPATLTSRMDVGDVLSVQDPLQSAFFVGVTSTTNSTYPKVGGIFMTRDIHKFGQTPDFWQIAHLPSYTTPMIMKTSWDGDHLFVGCTNGRVYRVSNLNQARDWKSAHVDSSGYALTLTQVAYFPNRIVTDIDVDPNNANRVAVSLGNYGNSQFVYLSSNALATSPSFVPKQGNMPQVPVYLVSFDKGNTNRLIAGTEMGIYMSDNVNATPTWVEENTGLGRVPVFDMEQYRTENNYNPNDPNTNDFEFEGDLFIATHGRGFFTTSSTQVARPVGLEEPSELETQDALGLFPNPAVNEVNVPVNQGGAVTITLRDMEGRLIHRIDMKRVPGGVTSIPMNVSELPSGLYIVTRTQGGEAKSETLVR